MMPERDWHLIPQMCADIIAICDRAAALNAAFLSERGMTWPQARALAQRERDALQADYATWYAARRA